MLSQKNIEAFDAIYISGIKIAMEVGGVKRVRFILEELQSFVEQANMESWTKTFQEAKDWLAKATQYEQDHGEGSFFDPEHPHIKSIRAYRQRYHMPGDRVGSSESSAESLSTVSNVLDQAPDSRAA